MPRCQGVICKTRRVPHVAVWVVVDELPTILTQAAKELLDTDAVPIKHLCRGCYSEWLTKDVVVEKLRSRRTTNGEG